MKKRLKLIVLGLFLAGIVFSTIRTTIQWSSQRQARADAEAWLALARSVVTTVTTKDDAVAWLRENGGENVGIGRATQINGTEYPDLRVTGYRVFSEGSFWAIPSTADLDFKFDDGWRFREIEMEILPYLVRDSRRVPKSN
jgi:hypothetical protein